MFQIPDFITIQGYCEDQLHGLYDQLERLLMQSPFGSAERSRVLLALELVERCLASFADDHQYYPNKSACCARHSSR